MVMEKLIKDAQEIFENWESRTDEENNKAEEKANKLLESEPYQDIYSSWDFYLKNKTSTTQDVKDFLLGIYCIFKTNREERFTTPYPFDPYDFAGFVLAKIDVDKNWEYVGDIPLPLVIDVLGISEDQYETYDYWSDPKVIEASKKYL